MSQLVEGISAPVAPRSAERSRQMSWRHHVFLLRRAAASARHLRRVPVAGLEEMFPGIGELQISMRYRFEERGLPHGDAYVLSLISAWVAPKRIFEIGTGVGAATLLMACQAPEASIDTLDLGESPASLGEQRGDEPITSSAVGRAFHGSPYEVVQHLGDSASFDFEPFRGQIDLAFVDGAHTYDYVARDSQTALSMLAPGGTIVWDDCHLYHPDVSAALLGLCREGRDVRRIEGTRLAVFRDAPQAASG